MTSLLVCLVAVSFCRRTVAEDEESGPADRVVVRHAVTDYERSSLLGASTFGVLQDCLVELGDKVKPNQVLGRLYDKEARAEMALLKAKCESDLAIRLSEAKHAEALAKLKASRALKSRNMVSNEEFTLHQLKATTCELELAEAKFEVHLGRMRYDQAEAVARSREIVSPHEGIVVAMFRKQNEVVSPTEPAFHVVDVGRVRVTGHVDVGDAWRVRAGQPVRVAPEVGGADLPIETRTFEGRVRFVDPLIDRKKQTCRVVAEVANRGDELRAGLEARMEILVGGAEVADSRPLPMRAAGEGGTLGNAGAGVPPTGTVLRAKK